MSIKFKDSILFRLNFLIFSGLFVTYSIITAFELIQYQKEAMESIDVESVGKINRLENNLISPLWTFNEEDANALLNFELDRKYVKCITVRKPDKSIFVSKYKDDNGKITNGIAEKGSFDKKISKKIMKENKEIGEVEIQISVTETRQKIKHQLLEKIATSFFSDLLLGSMVILFVNKVVIKPLQKLGSSLHDIAQGER